MKGKEKTATTRCARTNLVVRPHLPPGGAGLAPKARKGAGDRAHGAQGAVVLLGRDVVIGSGSKAKGLAATIPASALKAGAGGDDVPFLLRVPPDPPAAQPAGDQAVCAGLFSVLCQGLEGACPLASRRG